MLSQVGNVRIAERAEALGEVLALNVLLELFSLFLQVREAEIAAILSFESASCLSSLDHSGAPKLGEKELAGLDRSVVRGGRHRSQPQRIGDGTGHEC